jgi:hypothetical protein
MSKITAVLGSALFFVVAPAMLAGNDQADLLYQRQ